MRNAHTLSTGLSPDSTLFGPPQPDSVARWLYVPGDLEGSLMARMKQDAIRACNRVFHPGAFRRPHLGVLFAHAFELTAVPATFPITLWHSGNLRFDLNNTNCLRSDAHSTPASGQRGSRAVPANREKPDPHQRLYAQRTGHRPDRQRRAAHRRRVDV